MDRAEAAAVEEAANTPQSSAGLLSSQVAWLAEPLSSHLTFFKVRNQHLFLALVIHHSSVDLLTPFFFSPRCFFPVLLRGITNCMYLLYRFKVSKNLPDFQL